LTPFYDTDGYSLPVGSLSGTASSWLEGLNNSGRTCTYVIGASNEDAAFAGTIRKYNNSGGSVNIEKTGTGKLTLSGANTAFGGNVTVSAGELEITDKLTVSGNLVNNASLTLAPGATVLTGGAVSGTGASNVKQTLSTENSRKWYYLSSPVAGATTALFGATDQIGSYDEATHAYIATPLTSADNASLAVGTGYAVKLGGANPTLTFSGTLNGGNVNIPVSRTGSDEKSGFNLVGNPYPSYIDWDAISAANSENIQSTIWTRTFEADNMVFKTYNADAQVGSDDESTAHIAPLQAFWVRVPDSKTDESGLTLDLTDAQRSHKESGDAGLRASKAETRPIVRLQVSNGANRDNAVILSDENAQDGFDSYDSEKMSNEIAAVPEIWTLAGTEKLVINTLNTIPENTEIALGFKTGTAGSFSISATAVENISGELKVFLKDKTMGVNHNLSAGGAYEFTSGVVSDESRFAIVFGTDNFTGIASQNAGVVKLTAYANANREIAANAGRFTVFNVFGQQVNNHGLPAGVYFVKAGNETVKVVVK